MKHSPKAGSIKKSDWAIVKEPTQWDADNTIGSLLYKGELVAENILASYYADDDDYNYYDCHKVWVENNIVKFSGRRCEVGADRPGLSWCSEQTVEVGKLEGEQFIVNKEYKVVLPKTAEE